MKGLLLTTLLFPLYSIYAGDLKKQMAFKEQKDLQHEYLQKDCEFYTQEIKITNQKVARKIFRWMPGEKRQVNGVYGTWYKHHEFLFCVRNNEALTTCSIYFSDKADGSLASFYKDKDYGKGDIVEATYQKPINFKSDLYLYENRLNIKFNHPKAVKKVFTKIDLAEQSDSKGVNYTSETYEGKHVSCTQYDSEQGEYLECLISIPLPREKRPKTPLPNT
jgi:hypothetical protein